MTKHPGNLKPAFSPLGIWALSIGTSIGWGSFVVSCNTYLQKSGILGTALGLVLGLAVIFVITWNLQHMIRTAPNAGGVYAFQKRISGNDLGFIAFWFVLLTYLGILWSNITAVPLFARFFLGNTFQFGFHYSLFGYSVWFGETLLAVAAIALVGILCSVSSRLSSRIIIAAALTFIAALSACGVLAVIKHDPAFSYSPMFTGETHAFNQIIHIAAISPWAFIGFENISLFSEEYDFPHKKVRGILISSIIITTVLYLVVSLLSVSVYPPEYDSWLAYVRDSGNLQGIKSVPVFYAVHHYLGETGITVLMVTMLSVILTSLFGNLLALSRLLYAAGRDGEIHKGLSKLDARGIPSTAIFSVIAITIFIPFLGRTAVGWIVDVTTLGAVFTYWLISHGVYLQARQTNLTLERYTGAAGMVLMGLCAILLLVPGILPLHAMEQESYILFVAWALIGFAYFRWRLARHQDINFAVWLGLLLLVLFASQMWASRQTETETREAAVSIYEYRLNHPESTATDAGDRRTSFLHKQAQIVANNNTAYTFSSLILFLLCTGILLYKDRKRLDRRISAAEQAARDARKIAALKESIGALLDNMPVMCASKDAESGVYLACNQSFADYAGKKTPESVAGLTDRDLFDPKTADHFAEGDRIVRGRDKPYVVFQSVADPEGNPRRFQTTKLKFRDSNGKLCLLSMSVDLTEMERIRQESEQTKAAYQQVLSTSAIYESIVDALSEDYFVLYYVNVETDDFIQYDIKTAEGRRMAETRGTDFFARAREQAQSVIYGKDREKITAALDKERLLGEIQKHGASFVQYRLMIDNQPTYVNLKATRISGDDRHIIIGVNNVDAQVRDRLAAEQAAEQRKAYIRHAALSSNLIVQYFVDPETEQFSEFSPTSDYEKLGIAKQGGDFFSLAQKNSRKVIHPDDQKLFQTLVTKEHILETIRKDGRFTLSYRMVHDDVPQYVKLKAALIEEDGKPTLIMGLFDEDAEVRHEQEYAHLLSEARHKANTDALTGVKNKNAYVTDESELNALIAGRKNPAFAVVVCDLNNLKTVNDTLGHKAGDTYIRKACSVLCGIFDHSPVFRVGGDEFVVICQGHDYEHIEELLEKLGAENAQSKKLGDVQIAFGMARFDGDKDVESVFTRADQLMYKHKAQLKA
jgi:diguanylate cyclase (GGDEF)-like protein